jgi:hypothetical protein
MRGEPRSPGSAANRRIATADLVAWTPRPRRLEQIRASGTIERSQQLVSLRSAADHWTVWCRG